MSMPVDGGPDPMAAAAALTGALNGMRASLEQVRQDSEARDAELAKAQRALREAQETQAETQEILAAAQRRQERYERRNRVLVIVDIALTVLTSAAASLAIWALTGVNSNTATLSEVRASQVQGCRVNNDAKDKQAGLWAFVIGALQPPASDTPAQRAAGEKFLARLEGHVAMAYEDRNCQKAYKGPQ